MALYEKHELITGHVDSGHRLNIDTTTLENLSIRGIDPTFIVIDDSDRYLLTYFKEEKRAKPRKRTVGLQGDLPEKGHFAAPLLNIVAMNDGGNTIYIGPLRFTQSREIDELRKVTRKRIQALGRVGDGSFKRLIKSAYAYSKILKGYIECAHLVAVGTEPEYGSMSGFPVPNLHGRMDGKKPIWRWDGITLGATPDFAEFVDAAANHMKNPPTPSGVTTEEFANHLISRGKAIND